MVAGKTQGRAGCGQATGGQAPPSWSFFCAELGLQGGEGSAQGSPGVPSFPAPRPDRAGAAAKSGRSRQVAAGGKPAAAGLWRCGPGGRREPPHSSLRFKRVYWSLPPSRLGKQDSLGRAGPEGPVLRGGSGGESASLGLRCRRGRRTPCVCPAPRRRPSRRGTGTRTCGACCGWARSTGTRSRPGT